jgi:DnaJ domain
MHALIYYLDNGSIEIRTPYHADFVEALKLGITSPYRSCEPDEKVWIVKSFFADQAIAIVRKWFDSVEIFGQPKTSHNDSYRHQNATPPPPPKPGSDDPFRVLYLLNTAPPEVIKASYHALSKKHHPDRGGDTQTMQRINAAYDRLKDRLA